MTDPSLQVCDLTKVYPGDVYAISDVDLALSRGVFGLLGPNGAGKTTLLRLLATILKPSSGHIVLNGIDSSDDRRRYRANIGYLPQNFGLYPNLSALDHLLFFSPFNRVKGSEAKNDSLNLLDEVGLLEEANRPTSEFSGGMKQRLGIAIALLGEPCLLMLDEPTAGLDPQERIRFRSLIEKVSRKSIVIISTHIVQDIELGCSKVAILNEGRVLQESSPDELISFVNGKTWVVDTPLRYCDEIKRLRSVTSVRELSGDQVRIRYVGDGINQGESPSIPTLEDAYIYLLSLTSWKDR